MTEKGKVLVAEDSSVTRSMLTSILEEFQYEVIAVEHGAEALERILRESFDLLLTDVNMPEMDGIELIQNVRSNEQLVDLPIIILSTETENVDRKIGLEAGANLYLGKPVSPKKLVYKIRSLLEHSTDTKNE